MTHPFIVTANRTTDGAVVYLGPDRVWSRELGNSVVTSSEAERDELLVWARAQQADVCDPYALEVERTPVGARVRSARERIRAEGPEPMLRRLGLLR